MTSMTVNAQNIEALKSSNNAITNLLISNKTKLIGRDDVELTTASQSVIILIIILNIKYLEQLIITDPS